MKKILSYAGILAAAAMTLMGCAQEIDQPNVDYVAGVPFELTADVAATKTVNDGLATRWADNDGLNVFFTEAGVSESENPDYGKNCEFKVADVEAGLFKGTLHTALDAAKSYDWYVIYTAGRASYTKSPASRDNSGGYSYIGDSRGLKQPEYGSKAHLVGSACPMYAVAKAVSAESALEFTMNHMTSVIELNVTNNTAEALTINSAVLTVPGKDIVGSYYFDVTTSPVTLTPVADKTYDYAKVTVTAPTELAVGSSAKLYFVVKPTTIEAGAKWSIQINDTDPVEKEVAADITFNAGEIHTVNYSVTELNEPAPAPEPSKVTVAEFKAAVEDDTVYELTGEISSIRFEYSPTYNNISFFLKDETGEVQIFRMSCEGVADPTSLTVGDLITVRGTRSSFDDEPQMAQGCVYVSHTDVTLEPADPWDTAASYVNGAEATDDARMKELRAYADADYLYVRLTATNATPFGANYLDFFFTDGEGTTEVWWGWTNTGTDIYYQEHKCELNENGELTKMRWYPVEGDRVYIEDYTTTVSDTEVLWDIKFPRSYVDVYKSSTGTVHMSFILWSDWDPYWAIPARWNPMLEVTLP